MHALAAMGDATTVYVEGISYNAAEEDVDNLFRPCGAIIAIRLPRWHDSGKPRGYAHVEFQDRHGCAAALALDGETMMGRYLRVSRAKVRSGGGGGASGAGAAPRAQPAGCKVVFVKNLPYACTEDMVVATFSTCGKVQNVRLARWRHTGRLKGFGYVEFANAVAARAAVDRNGLKVGSRKVFVDYEEGKAKAGYKGGY